MVEENSPLQMSLVGEASAGPLVTQASGDKIYVCIDNMAGTGGHPVMMEVSQIQGQVSIAYLIITVLQIEVSFLRLSCGNCLSSSHFLYSLIGIR